MNTSNCVTTHRLSAEPTLLVTHGEVLKVDKVTATTTTCIFTSI